MPELTFDWHLYAAATAVYMIFAAIIAAIFPYRGTKTEWKAFALGAGLPVIISGLVSATRTGVPVRGPSPAATLRDVLSLF